MKKLLFSVLMSMSIGAFADSYSKAYDQCVAKSGGVLESIWDCTSTEYSKQDARLHANYKKVMGGLNGEAKQHLLDSQQLWIKYTDSACNIYMYPEIIEETMYTLAAVKCYLKDSKRRADYLEDLIKAVE